MWSQCGSRLAVFVVYLSPKPTYQSQLLKMAPKKRLVKVEQEREPTPAELAIARKLKRFAESYAVCFCKRGSWDEDPAMPGWCLEWNEYESGKDGHTPIVLKGKVATASMHHLSYDGLVGRPATCIRSMYYVRGAHCAP